MVMCSVNLSSDIMSLEALLSSNNPLLYEPDALQILIWVVLNTGQGTITGECSDMKQATDPTLQSDLN